MVLWMILIGKQKENPPGAKVAFEVKGSSYIGGKTDEFPMKGNCTARISLRGDCWSEDILYQYAVSFSLGISISEGRYSLFKFY